VSWARFSAEREQLLHTLAPPILSALGNDDTPSPIFHGCSDWHSAVHGLYSLYAIHRRTGSDLYLEAARQTVRPELVEEEVRYMESEAILGSENPYGFAWTLALAAVQEHVTGTHELRPLADFAAARIVELVESLDDSAAFDLATCDAHRNLSFALIHLALWARHIGDERLLELADEATRAYLQTERLDEALPLERDTVDVEEFMAPALMRLAAVGTVLEDEGSSYARRRMPPSFDVPPLTEPTTVHAAGVNFFRAFALVLLQRATGRARLRQTFARLMLYQVGRTDLWLNGDYAHRHWIAQIGVRAIDESY
jgi:hypothetical protein